ncbi:GrpB family protein [Ileibacterium valens]|uniref:GrpB family protein n=1 Tax=Ileibacterium valens TaxID=1862668 RepID=UPI002354308C|nr:GrpB family protein [Ileibacterium valens]
MLGLKRGTVRLEPHQDEWKNEAEKTIQELKDLLGLAAIDIQHIGSTAIPLIHAKPIIDLVIGVQKLDDIQPFIENLQNHGFIFRGEDVAGQILLVKGDFKKDVRTHHIHVVKWNGDSWNNYINFRDFLNVFPEKALSYDTSKMKLASQYQMDRNQYTNRKQRLITTFLEEAKLWKANQSQDNFS